MWDILLKNLPLAILLILAIIICGADLIKAIDVWRKKRQEKVDQSVNEQLNDISLTETLLDIQSALESIQSNLKEHDKHFEKIDEKISELTVSDMHDIKSWIVDQYLKFYVNQGCIDAFNAETLDRRYEDYKKEGGNSYIDVLMDRLHTLPIIVSLDDKKE